jgi:hypothetical protein
MRAFEKKFFYHLKTMIQDDFISVIFDNVDSESEIEKK